MIHFRFLVDYRYISYGRHVRNFDITVGKIQVHNFDLGNFPDNWD